MSMCSISTPSFARGPGMLLEKGLVFGSDQFEVINKWERRNNPSTAQYCHL